ncbi:glycosyltransferase family 2 protein [Actinocorallia longicatena]|uniref:glycosyltransferase family 2 protein n=1 Tax=Actinocorallia longicatena TaxID=111803 RepID=UPI0031E2084F
MQNGSASAVTVVIATRDRPGQLEEAALAALRQDHPGPLELLVVFDQVPVRELDLGDLPAGRSLRLMANKRTPGLPGGRNTGIGAATGEYIAFCDDDDSWLPGKVTAQLSLLADHPGSFASGTGVEVRSPGGSTVRLVPFEPVELRHLLRDRVFELHPSSVLVRRDRLVAEAGLVDEEIPGGYAEDYDLALRIARIAPIPCVPEPLTIVNWGGSFFAHRFPMIADALEYLLAKHPEFTGEPAGLARVQGQIAFYRAASGSFRAALGWARRALRGNWREPRAYLALLLTTRLVGAERVLRVLNARGRGV